MSHIGIGGRVGQRRRRAKCAWWEDRSRSSGAVQGVWRDIPARPTAIVWLVWNVFVVEYEALQGFPPERHCIAGPRLGHRPLVVAGPAWGGLVLEGVLGIRLIAGEPGPAPHGVGWRGGGGGLLSHPLTPHPSNLLPPACLMATNVRQGGGGRRDKVGEGPQVGESWP